MPIRGNLSTQRPPAGPVTAEPRPNRAAVARAEPAPLQQALGNQGVLGRLGPGRPLDAGTRQRMEGVLGSDFSRVRVHTGAEGAVLAGRLQARAVTMGEDIAFAPGEYRPGTPLGDAILAHELAHVVQQRGAQEESPATAAVEPATSPLEREAEGSAVGAVAALWAADRQGARPFAERARPTLKSARRLQRCGYNAEHPPHTFNSCGFSATGGGALQVNDVPTAPAPGLVTIDSPTYRASGDVSISGGTDAEASDWEAGFLQTDLESKITLDYFNAGVHHIYHVIDLPGPTRDGDTGIIPWYGQETVRPFTRTGQSVHPAMSDSPQTPARWKSPDGVGSLVSSSGYDRFCSWMVVRQKSSSDIVFLNWATWEVDWGAGLDPVAKTGSGKGAGTRVTGRGDGQGAFTPQLTDPVANTVVNDPAHDRWVP